MDIVNTLYTRTVAVIDLLKVRYPSPSFTALPYDPGFALRTCMENGCLKATIALLKSLGLYEQAVEEV